MSKAKLNWYTLYTVEDVFDDVFDEGWNRDDVQDDLTSHFSDGEYGAENGSWKKFLLNELWKEIRKKLEARGILED